MISMEEAKRLLLEPISNYLAGNLSGAGLVKVVDDLIGEDVISDFPQELVDAVDALQDDLALYVRDEATRNESPVYFGEAELREKMATFMRRLEAM